MGGITRILLGALGVIVLLAVAALLILGANLDSAVREAVVRFAPDYTGTSVQLDAVDLSPLSGEGELRGLQVDNPEGYEGPYALRLERVRLALELGSLTSDVIRIRELTIEGAAIEGEIAPDGRTNLRTILDNVESAIGATGDQAPPPEAKATRFSIDRLDFVDASAVLRAPSVARIDTVEVEAPELHLRDLGRDGGITGGELAAKVLRPIVTRVIEEAARDRLGDAIESKVGGKAGEALDRLRQMVPSRE